MKAWQASWDSSSWLRTFFSKGCLRGSLVQHQILSFPLPLLMITRLSVLFEGGLEDGKVHGKVMNPELNKKEGHAKKLVCTMMKCNHRCGA